MEREDSFVGEFGEDALESLEEIAKIPEPFIPRRFCVGVPSCLAELSGVTRCVRLLPPDLCQDELRSYRICKEERVAEAKRRFEEWENIELDNMSIPEVKSYVSGLEKELNDLIYKLENDKLHVFRRAKMIFTTDYYKERISRITEHRIDSG